MSRINKETLTVSEYDIIHTNFETIFEIVFIIEIVKGCVSLRAVRHRYLYIVEYVTPIGSHCLFVMCNIYTCIVIIDVRY